MICKDLLKRDTDYKTSKIFKFKYLYGTVLSDIIKLTLFVKKFPHIYSHLALIFKQFNSKKSKANVVHVIITRITVSKKNLQYTTDQYLKLISQYHTGNII